jgi:hypothetical protein
MMNAKTISAAVALVCGAALVSPACAQVTQLGNLDPEAGGSFSENVPNGPVAVFGTFFLTTSAEAETAASATIAVNRPNMYTPGTLWLYTNIGTATVPVAGTLLASDPLTLDVHEYTASLSDTLGPGDYFVEITGNVNVKHLGVGGTVTTFAVPEPSTWAMLGLGFAALGAIGFFTRRKDERYAAF